MEIIGLLTDNLGAVAFAILGMGGVIALCYGGWLYQTSFGDQQQQMKARNAVWGGVLGVLIGGFSFAIPEILSSEILARSGGDPIVVRASSECDEVLKNRLAHEVHANTAARMQQLVRLVQADNRDGCGADLWNPVVGVDAGGSGIAAYADYRSACFGQRPNSSPAVRYLYGTSNPRVPVNGIFGVGGLEIPASLTYDLSGGWNGIPRAFSSRDSRNNVLVYFGQLLDNTGNPKAAMDTPSDVVSSTEGFPTSGEKCWLFIARENLWVGN